MKLLRDMLDRQYRNFAKGGKYEKFYALFEVIDTFLFTPKNLNKGPVHISDALDLKRLMVIVIVALIPATIMALYNTGLQANLALGAVSAESWRFSLMKAIGVPLDPKSVLSNMLLGALYFLPVYIVTMVVGGFWEVLFASIRKHDVNEGFLVTGLLFPLILPPDIPLWQAAVGISFGVVLGKEVFGGTGMNLLNPALVSRAFLFFAYPAQISGNSVWVGVDGFTKATPLGIAAQSGLDGIINASYSWLQAFYGFIPGSMGETSTLACLIGAVILILTGIGAWRIMAGILVGAFSLILLFNYAGSATNPMFLLTAKWHFVLGGFAFGTVFMATDPVSAAMTNAGKWIYGILIGAVVILIRVVNPAFPEGMMLAILLGNVFAPTIDHFVVNANIKRRKKRYGSIG